MTQGTGNIGTLAAIHIHPVKSCRRIELDRARIGATGLEHDRQWQVVTDDGEAVTQRQHPVMATIQPEVTDGRLVLHAPGIGDVAVAAPTANDRVARALLGDEVNCADAGDDAAAFVSEVLGAPCRLVGLTPDSQRTVGLFPKRSTSFADAAPVLVANTASLADLQGRSSEAFGMDRFRANLIVDTDAPWAEDTWTTFSIGAAELVATLPWPRCAVPQIDQDTGERHSEPAKVLRVTRWCAEAPGYPPGLRAALEGNALFGMAASIEPEGAEVAIGDVLAVSGTTEPLLSPPPPA